MFDISTSVIFVGAMILVLMGLIIAYKGFDLLKHFVRSTGAIIGGIVFFIIGGVIGMFFGPLIAIAAAIIMGILGLMIGALLAPTLLWLMLSIVVFIVCFNIGGTVAENFGASGIMVLVIGMISGFIGAWMFSFLARKLLVGATSVVGGLMVGAGTFMIIIGLFGFTAAAIGGTIALVLVALTGYTLNMGKKRKRSKKKKK